MSHSTRTSVSLGHDEDAPRARVFTYDDRSPIGRVDLDGDAVSISATAPADLLSIAEAFTDAARQLSDELDKQAAREANAARAVAGRPHDARCDETGDICGDCTARLSSIASSA